MVVPAKASGPSASRQLILYNGTEGILLRRPWRQQTPAYSWGPSLNTVPCQVARENLPTFGELSATFIVGAPLKDNIQNP